MRTGCAAYPGKGGSLPLLPEASTLLCTLQDPMRLLIIFLRHPPQALTLGGQKGVEEALALLHYELELSMALLGCPTVDQVTRDFVIQPPGYPLDVPAARR